MVDIFWDTAYKCNRIGLEHIARIFELISMVISSHAISAKISIGKNSKFYHHGLGCCSLGTTIIGDNCKVFQNVTFGYRFNGDSRLSIKIGNNCMIGAGSVILGG